MTKRPIRLATRAVLLHQNRLLMVNAFPGNGSDLWCAPGGGAEPGQSLPDNLSRELYEETGLQIVVGAPCLINEFHNPDDAFHQVEIFFRCTLASGKLDDRWLDPENIVTKRRFFTRSEMSRIRFKPDSLPRVAWGGISMQDNCTYDALERLLPQ